MSKISCKLFGIPRITKDGQSVFLPYAKINALLYYILVTKEVSRDEVAGLLWPDEDEKTAKKNIRNAIYQAKKSLGVDIIISPKKSFLMLNQELDVEIDVELFTHAPRENMQLYSGDFLQGFFLKETEAYEYWIVKMRTFYAEKFTAESYLKIEDDIQNKNYDEVENNIQRLIDHDEYDERNFRLLMRFYQDTGRNSKVIETYYDLSKLLRRELGIDPDKKTKEIYERSLEQINFGGDKKHAQGDSFFYGRYNEIAASEKALKNFRQGKEGKSLLISGEVGMGKSTIKQKLLEEAGRGFFLLEADCYQVEQALSLRPWSIIAKEISRLIQKNQLIPPALWKDLMTKIFPDFGGNLPNNKLIAHQEDAPFDRIVHLMVEALAQLATQQQVILLFEDLQWMDADSLRLLTAVMLESNPLQLLLIATCDKEQNQPMEDALTALRHYNRLTTITLERFDIEACHHFVKKALPDYELTGETLERIYNETEGNPFFLNEYITMLRSGAKLDRMSPAMTSAIKARFLYLTPEELELVNALSFSYDEVPFQLLLALTGKSEAQMLGLLERLKGRNILTERETEKDTSILFTHAKLREYIYTIQPLSRKRVFHQKIGLLLEEMFDPRKVDSKLCSKLTYHFSASGDYLKALKYKVDTLNHYLNFSHEMFPVLNNLDAEQDAKLYMSRDKIEELFYNLESSFQEILGSSKHSAALDLLELGFFYMKGRYLIREGRYEDGVNNIMYVIEKSRQIDDRDYTLEGYKQMILYHLQINNPKDMSKYVELALDLAVKCNYHKETGILLRLKGLYHIMSGNYYLAEKLLVESINTLSVTEDVAKRYAANIAAAYGYIGEIRQAQENYSEALLLFQKAILLCVGKNALAGLSYFYINAGKTCYVLADIPATRDYFEKAYSLYGQFDSFWRRPVLDSYMALTLIREQNYPHALQHLNFARESVGYIKDPCDLGTVLFAEALIRGWMEENAPLRQAFGESLTEPMQDYAQRALAALSDHCNRYEIAVLNEMLAKAAPLQGGA